MALKRKRLIPAVAYLRKSTAGQNGKGKERQEKSIDQQRREIVELAKGRYKIIRWYSDEGVSGWKRNHKRPGFNSMLSDAKEKADFQAILCDDLDRFSRAEVMEVFSDLSTLASAGVTTIHCVNQGEYDLGEDCIGRIIKLVVDVHGGNEFSRKLSRRISLSRRNAAMDGKRSGGNAPYGLANDGKAGLKFGDRKQMKVVRWIFDQFANNHKSMNWIAGQLNKEGTPSRHGGKWYVATVKETIQQRAYRGDFVFNQKKSGRFFIINDKHEVVEASNRPAPVWKATDDGVFICEGIYKPLIDPALFDLAQTRLGSFAMKGSRRPREDGYSLSRILVCDHCGKPMYGCKPRDRHRVYRCSSNAKTGSGSCGNHEIREDRILPFILQTLGREIEDITLIAPQCPEELFTPWEGRQDQREQIESKAAELTATIERAEENLLYVNDARTRRSLDAKVTKLRDELDNVNAELDAIQNEVSGTALYTQDEMTRLREWWEEFCRNAVTVPLASPDARKDDSLFATTSYVAAFDELSGDASPGLKCDRRVVNEALHALGTEVRLRWRTERRTLANGKTQNRYKLSRGRFRLGQISGELPCQEVYSTICDTVQWQSRRGSFL